ncbi:LysR family transcriptional regulator [Blautia sp. MSJ-19]|uniref:LysR family transcriptional regulator n=1 Tax=Blautia sp. MSJ-19 TaxID=2841517 RepID=UPI001C0EA4AE|nr:LysR family transcriptional regulator [Blautia sp. MSJ-19]MBU5481689.1 LysR family transcriptional regulator [Blautia sp. MSJ-19]
MKDSDWEILYELYKNPNMTKVANLLYMTQPSLTKRLQHMESEFQVTIVNRTPKGLEFTEEGEFLGKQAGQYLEFLSKTKEKLKEFQENSEGVITIGSSYTYSKYTLTDLLVQYKQKHPNVEFNIINEQSNILFRKMLEDAIDVGFIRGDYDGAVNKTLIGRNEAYLVTKEPVDFDMLPQMQRIGYKTNDRTKELLDNWWQGWFGSEAPGSMIVGYIDVSWQLIHKGLGYTICFLPDNFENTYDLCLTPLKNRDGSSVTRNTWFIYSKNKRITRVLEDFIDYIEKEVAVKGK